ncbi:hypothetical protein H1Q63_16545 [Desmonostoc muscorum CCALA 125]|nr:hypothetical protein [Desmonostoc muscorum CCALA 125]
MNLQLLTRSVQNFSAVVGTTLLLGFSSLPVQAISFVTVRDDLNANDKIDWSSLDFGISAEILPGTIANFLPYSFDSKSENGLGYGIDIPVINNPRFTTPFVFPVSPNLPINFSDGDAILFTGFIPGGFPAQGNPGPITITFDTPVLGAGTQIGVDDTFNFTAFISAFDDKDNLLGSFSIPGTSSTIIDNSAVFIGVSNEIANISKLVISSSENNRALGINFLSISRTSIPEPGTILALSLFGIGLLFNKQKFAN